MSLALVAPFPPPSARLACSRQDLWWVPLPGPRAPRYPRLSPTWSPVVVGTVLRCFDFFLRQPRSLVCPFCSVPFPRRPLALCCTPSFGAVGSCSRFFSSPCFLPRGSLLPACTHNKTASPSVSVQFGAHVQSQRHPVARLLAVPGHARWSPLPLSSFSPLNPPLPPVSCPPSYCCSPARCARRWSSLRKGCMSRSFTRLRAPALSFDL